MSEMRWVPRWLKIRMAWWLTTHPGFYSPCDDDHCIEVRAKARHGNATLTEHTEATE